MTNSQVRQAASCCDVCCALRSQDTHIGRYAQSVGTEDRISVNLSKIMDAISGMGFKVFRNRNHGAMRSGENVIVSRLSECIAETGVHPMIRGVVA